MLNFEDLVRTPGFVANPYDAYAQIRDNDHRGQTWAFGNWMYFRHEHATAVLRHPGFGQEESSTTASILRRPVVQTNPPEHSRLRALLTAAFPPRSLHRLRPRIESLTDELISAITRAGSADLVADFARRVPITIIGELLGMPAADRELIMRAGSVITLRPAPGERPSRDQLTNRRLARKELRAYFRDLIRERRRSPGDDLVTRLLEANRDGDRLEDADVVANCVFLLVAGHATTVSLIANSAWNLLRQPDQLATLLSLPLQNTAWVDELLRYEAPLQMTSRTALSEFTFESRSFVPGDQVIVVLGSANRDPAAYEHPDELDLTRTSSRHISFGMGIHFCLGAQLAQLEGEVAIRALAQHLGRASFDPSEVQWRRNMVLRELAYLPIRLRPASKHDGSSGLTVASGS